jgi:ribosome-associated protein
MPTAATPLVAGAPPWCPVAVMDDDLVIRSGLVIPAAELSLQSSRASGPGGQHVNKTSTRVSLRWNARSSSVMSAAERRRLSAKLASRLTRSGDLVIHCSETRSFSRNREIARERLAAIVREAIHAPRRRVATRPGKGARERRLTEKKQRSTTKQGRRRPSDHDH